MAYLLGSIPTAVWLGKAFFRTDVREHGSGNAGATNTFRTLGKGAGAIVLVLDILKGWLAASLPWLGALAGLPHPYVPGMENPALLLGLIAAVGHIYPVFAGFRGGKGVATLLGVLIGIDYVLALVCVGVFLVEFIIFRWVSLGSMLAAIAFAIAYTVVRHPYAFLDNLLVALYPLLIILTHRQNISRLLAGKEPKMFSGKGKTKPAN
jgi:glycerol-3-phosphate acyltransferase PlsY